MTDLQFLYAVVSGGASGSILVWLLRGWISERLKQSIEHEYSQKLIDHKAELNIKIQEIQHEAELFQLRTSLFFNHQSAAFAKLLTKIASMNQLWFENEYEPEVGLAGPVPNGELKELRHLYHHHQLFLDSDCVAAIELLFDFYTDSLPFDDGSGGPPRQRDVDAAYDAVEYLHPRIAELFRAKIGVSSAHRLKEIALLGAIKLLNTYHFPEISLPVGGELKLRASEQAAGDTARAERHEAEVVSKLQELHEYLGQSHSTFHEARTKAGRYLQILSQSEM